MKTLDEVIEIFEKVVKHDYVWFDEKTALMTIETLTDVLHYLKEFKRISARLEKIALGNITETLEKLDNPALTWDELKQMEGEPVWVEHKYYTKWLIVKEVFENTIVLDGNGFYTQYFWDDNEKEIRWQAYRKEKRS